MTLYKKLKIIEFLKKEGLPVVSTKFLKKLTGLTNQQTLASCLESLVKYDILEKGEKGKYLVKNNLGNDFLVANLLYEPSYISLETALNLYGILSQFPIEISSITTKRKKSKNVGGKLYTYYQINPKYFWGFEKKENALLALPEKALLDSLYLASKGVKEISIEDLDLSKINKTVFVNFAKNFPQTKVSKNLFKKVLEKKASS